MRRSRISGDQVRTQRIICICPAADASGGSGDDDAYNRPLSKMAAENSDKLKSKTYTSTRKSTFTLVTQRGFSISGVISAEKM